ncbi:MAG: hypothetical protein NTW54_04185 [Bacteroidetes bacterium]|nr:hypothetical protein [Bacteroidota bacterium]
MKSKIILLTLILLAILPLITAFQNKPAVEELTLKQAIEKGYISCLFENNKGFTHYSKCLTLKISNHSSKMLTIKINNGIQVNPVDSVYQNLIVTENIFVTLNPQESKTTPIYAMCTEPHDRAPGDNYVTYMLSKDAIGVMKCVTDLITQNKYHNSEGQQAVWCVAEGSSLDAISGYDTIAVKKLQELISSNSVLRNQRTFWSECSIKTMSLYVSCIKKMGRHQEPTNKNMNSMQVFIPKVTILFVW